jgi:HPt (histidine-containing phosphotransfer) domain-containing protein
LPIRLINGVVHSFDVDAGQPNGATLQAQRTIVNTDGGTRPNSAGQPENNGVRLNQSTLLEHMLGDPGLLAEMVQLFLKESATHLANIESAVNSEDAEKIYATAHSFKGAVSNFAAPLATESATRLEQMGRSGNISGAAAEFAVLRQEIGLLKPLLLAVCQEVSQ